MPQPVSKRFSWLVWPLLALPVALYAAIALRYIVNVPWYDDVEMFVLFIQDFFQADSLHDKVYWLLEPNNEHRILFAKLAALGTYLATGHLNFRGMILVGNLFLFGTLALLFVVFRSMRLSLWAFVPVPFFLLHPQYYMTTSWSITSLQHPVVLGLVCGVMYLLALGGRNSFLWAIPLQIFASLAMSNALFGWASGLVVLWRQGHYRRLAVWAAVGLVTGVLYGRGYANTNGHGQSLAYVLANPHLVVLGILTFIGGSFDFLPRLPLPWRGVLPVLGGAGLVGLAGWLLSQMRWPFRWSALPPDTQSVREINQNFFLGVYGVLFINTLAVGLLRMRYGYDVMLVSNYMVYPALLLCLLYLHGLQTLSGQPQVRWQRAGLVVGGLVWGMAYFWHLPDMAFRHRFMRAYGYNQQHNGIGLGGTTGDSLAEYIQTALTGAVQKGYYVFPESPVADFPEKTQPIYAKATLGPYYCFLEGEGLPDPVREAYAVLRSPTTTYLVPAQNLYRLPIFWLRRPVVALQAEIRASDLKPGRYRVGWARESGSEKSLRFSDQVLTVLPRP